MEKPLPLKMIGEYAIVKTLGTGNFTAVWKAKNIVRGNKVAIKQVDLQKLNKSLRECLECEINFLRSVTHPNIIHLLDIMQAGDHLIFVLEYCAGGDLAAYIQRYGRVQEEVARKFMRQLGAGLEVLHAHHVIHRDLKPENLLLSTRDSDAVLKIADFGLSRCLSPKEYAEMVCGSPLYMAPEVLQFKKYDAKVLQNIRKCTVLPFPEDLHPDCIDMCTKLLCQDPVKRMSLEEFMHHKFVASM